MRLTISLIFREMDNFLLSLCYPGTAPNIRAINFYITVVKALADLPSVSGKP